MPVYKIKVSIPLEKSLYFLHPYNASLITCKGKTEKSNVMAAAWIIPVSVNPPLIGISIRLERYSHDLILEGKEFVVNIPTFEMAQKVLLCGRRSGKNCNKFKKASLTVGKAKKVEAPIIKECVAHIECKVVKTVKLGDHNLIVGKIVDAYALKGYFEEVYDITKFRPCLHVGKNFFTTCIRKRIKPEI